VSSHAYLLITSADGDGISKVLQHIGRRYVDYINKTYRRLGTLWEGRHKGRLIDDEHYLLTCYRYIELNPVTAAMVEKPEEYPWSSYHYNTVGKPDAIVTTHKCYMKLASEFEINGIRRCFSIIYLAMKYENVWPLIRSCVKAVLRRR
jgi:putative transposase